MPHAIVDAILSYGYGETHGEDKVLSDFQNYLAYKEVNPSKLKATNENINEFLDFVTGQRQPSDDEDSVSSRGEAGHDIVDVLSSSDEAESSTDQSTSEQESDSADDIEFSSDEGHITPVSARPGPSSSVRRAHQQDSRTKPLDAADKSARQQTLTAFMQPTSAGCMEAGLQQPTNVPKHHTSSSRPATAREAAMDLIDLANVKIFGNKFFRPKQREIIKAALQLPAVVDRGVAMVISPLLSLMQDQVTSLVNTDVPASFINSQQSKAEVSAVFQELSKPMPTCKLLYITPEQFVKSTSLRSLLAGLHRRGLLSRLIIDEAHCISSWGHDFRPEYKQLGQVKAEVCAGLPVMALTATATSKVIQDIIQSLKMPRCRQFQVSFYRSNLFLKVLPKAKGQNEEGNDIQLEAMMDYIWNQPPGSSGIVYCLSRNDAEGVAAHFREQGDIKAHHYHAGMTAKQRIKVQRQWRCGMVQVVCATIAFGMGIDKPDVRFVMHYTLPKSLEGYYQEAGRAGRDGKPSDCILYYAARDIPRIHQMLRRGARGRTKQARFQKGMELLDQVKDFCENQDICRHGKLLQYFGETLAGGYCQSNCNVCTQ